MKHQVNPVNQRATPQKDVDYSKAAGQQNWSTIGKGGNVRSMNDVPNSEKYAKPVQYRDTSDEALMKEVRSKIVSRGARGINGIKRVFKIMDDDNSKSLDLQEFQKAVKAYRISIDQNEVKRVFSLFDRDGNGSINYDEFLRAIVGGMNDRRKTIVTLAFKKFD